jgi:aminoglycoside phosphotransferase (APT) family kinase protein
MLSDISDYKNWIEIVPIETGLSGDKKFHITRNNGAELILRVSDIEMYKRHCKCARFSQYVHEQLGLNMNMPIEVAACCNDTLVYTLYTWVDGVDADTKICNLHTPEQAKYGESAGALLRKIHTIKAPADVLPWEEYFSKRLDEMIGQYKYSVKGEFKGDEQTLAFIEENRGLLVGRPQTALHGDFRSGNLIVTNSGELGIIDFGRWCWGDPYMDFQCAGQSCSAPFARGQINGYFEGNIPGDFFGLMSFYTAVDIIRRICLAYKYGKDHYDEAIKSAEKTFRQYEGFRGHVPAWY